MKMMLQFTLLILLLLSGSACGVSLQPQAEVAEAPAIGSPVILTPTLEVVPTPEIMASNQTVNE